MALMSSVVADGVSVYIAAPEGRASAPAHYQVNCAAFESSNSERPITLK
jgi:hypothetical protein